MSGPEKDEALALALAGGMTQVEAAKAAGINERTVRRKLDDAAFRALVTRHRDRLVAETFGRLVGAGSAASIELRKLLKASSAGVRLQAARTICELMIKLGTYNEVTARLAAVEAKLAVGPDGRQPRLIIPDHDDRWDIPEPDEREDLTP